jgi:hypothetical protein
MSDIIDLLQIKIEKAKRELPLEAVNAINSVDWKAVILGMVDKRGYTFEQLGTLELETELLLCGLLSSRNYPMELETRMKITKASANELVREMNEKVFSKIKEALIKSTDRKKIFVQSAGGHDAPGRSSLYSSPIVSSVMSGAVGTKNDEEILNSAGIKVVPDVAAVPSAQPMKVGNLKIPRKELAPKTASLIQASKVAPIFAQKLSGSVRIGTVKTEHTLENISKKTPAAGAGGANVSNATGNTKSADPYREIPE